ncbi:MAG: START-like domain-containing protein [Cytophagaceae bacterium]
MNKTKFTTEYEINASTKHLFPYLNTGSGLAEWFADKVQVDQDKLYSFVWDGKIHKARKVAQKTNQYVKFEFININTEERRSQNYIEFHLDSNELTQTSFLKIVDYTDDSEDTLQELWDNLVTTLKEKVGALPK